MIELNTLFNLVWTALLSCSLVSALMLALSWCRSYRAIWSFCNLNLTRKSSRPCFYIRQLIMSTILVFVTLFFLLALISRSLSAVSEAETSLSVRTRFEKNYGSYLLTCLRILFYNSLKVLANCAGTITIIFSKSIPATLSVAAASSLAFLAESPVEILVRARYSALSLVLCFG